MTVRFDISLSLSCTCAWCSQYLFHYVFVRLNHSLLARPLNFISCTWRSPTNTLCQRLVSLLLLLLVIETLINNLVILMQYSDGTVSCHKWTLPSVIICCITNICILSYKLAWSISNEYHLLLRILPLGVFVFWNRLLSGIHTSTLLLKLNLLLLAGQEIPRVIIVICWEIRDI